MSSSSESEGIVRSSSQVSESNRGKLDGVGSRAVGVGVVTRSLEDEAGTSAWKSWLSGR